MRTVWILCINLVLSTYAATSLPAQVRSSLMDEVAREVTSKEPGWKYLPGFCHCGRITAGELVHDVRSWERKVLWRRESIRMDSYTIASTEEATRWMSQWDREIAIGWPQVKRYDLADEAYLLDHRGGSDPFAVFLRRKNIIVEVSGKSLKVVERFARYAVKALPAS